MRRVVWFYSGQQKQGDVTVIITPAGTLSLPDDVLEAIARGETFYAEDGDPIARLALDAAVQNARAYAEPESEVANGND